MPPARPLVHEESDAGVAKGTSDVGSGLTVNAANDVEARSFSKEIVVSRQHEMGLSATAAGQLLWSGRARPSHGGDRSDLEVLLNRCSEVGGVEFSDMDVEQLAVRRDEGGVG